MGYKIIGSEDNYNFQTESHYTKEVEYEVGFDDVFDGVEIYFGENKEDYLEHLSDVLQNKGYKDLDDLEFLEVDTGDGELLFRVCEGSKEEILSITPTKYRIYSDVDLDELIDKDNDKLTEEIVEYLEIDSEDIKEFVKESKDWKKV